MNTTDSDVQQDVQSYVLVREKEQLLLKKTSLHSFSLIVFL